MPVLNIHELDLNLLVAFDAMMRERNVTRAGERVGLSQPAMSHALIRLRKLLGDSLFVRTRSGMEPTPLALELAESVREGLEVLQQGLHGAKPFDPLVAKRAFQIVMSDMGIVVYLPTIMVALKECAPNIDIRVLQPGRDQHQEAFESGDADLAIGVLPVLRTGFYQQRLFSDSYICIVRGDHPRIGTTLTVEQYAAESHIMIEPVGSRYSESLSPAATALTLIERQLAEHGLQRRIALRVPHFTVVPAIVRQTDFIATVPRQVMQTAESVRNLKMLPVPLELPNFTVRQFWHQRNHRDSASRWLHGLVSELFSDKSDSNGQ